MKPRSLLIALAVVAPSAVASFSSVRPVPRSSTLARTSAATVAVEAHTRRDALSAPLLAAIATAAALSPPTLPALADVTAKVASSSALRSVKRTLKELEGLRELAELNDYVAVKDGMRVPPFTEIRKTCGVLVRGGEDGPDAEALKSSYGTFIKSVETLDSYATLAIRGKKGITLAPMYEDAVKSLRSFLEVAERSAMIPLQEADDSSPSQVAAAE